MKNDAFVKCIQALVLRQIQTYLTVRAQRLPKDAEAPEKDPLVGLLSEETRKELHIAD